MSKLLVNIDHGLLSGMAAGLTRTQAVYDQLRADILAGRLPPGSRLLFNQLITRYDASMGVLREGLSRLAEQGLVQAEPQQGFRVTPLSAQDLRDLTAARCAIEGLVLREAVDSGSLAWEARVLAAHHTLLRTPQSYAEDPARLTDEWVAAHADYHRALLDGCANARLRGIAGSLRDSAELYRRWSVPLGGSPRDIAGEHRRILDAVLARKADAAVAALTDHIQHTTNALLTTVDPGQDQTGSGVNP
jgi:DNA-binding GntR family transcriptional regulator